MKKYAPPFDNEDYARGFDEGQKHQSPSPMTLERLKELETRIDKLPDLIESLHNEITELKTQTLSKEEMQVVKDFILGLAGGKMAGGFLTWVAGVIVSIGVIGGSIAWMIKNI